MKLDTKALGTIEIGEKQKVFFPQGLFGFETLQDYALLDAAQPPFFYLQSIKQVELAFVLINPFIFRPDFEIDTDDAELAMIGIDKPEQALVFSIVTIPEDDKPMTANLQGPIVMNRDTRNAKQVILCDPRWQTKHDIVKEMSELEKPTKGGRQC
jgi:flagellar assembly factor FliW